MVEGTEVFQCSPVAERILILHTDTHTNNYSHLLKLFYPLTLTVAIWVQL